MPETMKTVWCAGVDPRLLLTINLLQKDGFTEAETPGEAAVALCPPPWGEADLLSCVETLSPGALLVTGREFAAVRERCASKGLSLLCLAEEEDYRRENALATAEGVVAEAVRLLPRILAGETVGVLGYGACGREIARLFRALGCRVLVWSHPGSLHRAIQDGFACVTTALLPAISLMINTVPKPDFLSDFMPRLAEGSLFFQVASGPAPLADAMKRRGVACYPLPGLPGKFAPESEARAIADLVKARLADA